MPLEILPREERERLEKRIVRHAGGFIATTDASVLRTKSLALRTLLREMLPERLGLFPGESLVSKSILNYPGLIETAEAHFLGQDGEKRDAARLFFSGLVEMAHETVKKDGFFDRLLEKAPLDEAAQKLHARLKEITTGEKSATRPAKKAVEIDINCPCGCR